MKLSDKEDGGIHIFLMAMWVIFIVICFIYGAVYTTAITAQMNSLKSKCDFSNLAVYKNISQQDLSESGQVLFDSVSLNNIYSTFKSYLENNLNTDDNLKPKNQNSDIASPYVINRMIVYSVTNDNKISEYEYTDSSKNFTMILSNSADSVKTPNGKQVAETSVYTEVKFNLKLAFGFKYTGIVTSYTAATNK